MTQTNLIGWDIGGAHVKAAVINPAGDVIAVYQQPCPLWQGLDQLQGAVNRIMHEASGIEMPSCDYHDGRTGGFI